MDASNFAFRADAVAEIALFLDAATIPFATYRPPARCSLDTTLLADGEHVLRLEARDATGNIGRRSIPFQVQNGPGITITGLRANERVSGRIDIDVNAFGANEPFDPVRAESSGPIPVWTWVMITLIVAWAGWYGLTEFREPAAFAQVAASSPSAAGKAPAGFDYSTTGPNLYTANCSGCHGAMGAGVPGAFPALAGDPVVTAADPAQHVAAILHGVHGRTIKGVAFASQMPAFPQLSDSDIAAIVDHERTSWGNSAPVITPDTVKRAR